MIHTVKMRATASVVATVIAGAALTSCGSDDNDSSSSIAGQPIIVDGVEFPAPEKTSIKIGIPGITTGGLAQYYAIGAGIYEQFGLDVELVHFDSGAETTQALLAGQIDAGDTDISVISALSRPDPPQYAFVIRDNITDNLIAREDIKTGEDLKGEAIAISQFGSQSYAGALMALKSLGLSESDVTLTQVGGGSDRLAALLAGSVGASIQDPNEARAAAEQNFHTLVKIDELTGAGVVRTSMAFRESFIEENPNTVLALVAAVYKSRHDMFENPEQSAKYFAAEADLSIEEAQEAVDTELATKWLPADGRCSQETVEFMKQVLLSVQPELESVDPTAACNNQYIDQLHEMGFDQYDLETT